MSGSDALKDPLVAAVASAASFAHVAVDTGRGPHVTPVLYVGAGERIWFTVPRGSLKARVLRRRPQVTLLLRSRRRSVLLTGETRLLDPRRPLSLAGRPLESALAPFAIQAYLVRNSRELFGFALDASQLPATSMPANLVLASLDPEAAAVMRGATLAGHWGKWPGVKEADPGRAATRGGGRVAAMPALDGLPARVARLPGRPGPAVVGWTTDTGPLALPAHWDPNTRAAGVPSALLELAGARGESPACIAFDVSAGKRPSAKRGLMLRGRGRIVAGAREAAISIETDRITYWDGFETGTVKTG